MLWVPEVPDASRSFVIKNGVTFPEDIEYLGVVKLLEGYLAKTGANAVDCDEPLFTVSVFLDAGGNFCLVTSLNHMLGDMATFGRVRAMLDQAVPLTSLEIRRAQSFPEDLKKLVGEDRVPFGGHLVWHTVRGIMERAEPLKVAMRPVNTSYVDEIKNSDVGADDKEQIDSGDIITALSMKLFRADAAVTACDFRTRFPQVHSSLAGNYLEALLALPEDFNSGDGIRRLKQSCRSVQEDPDPDIVHRFVGVTSWLPYHHDVTLDGCPLITQFPLFDTDRTMPSVIIFCPRKGEIASLVTADKETQMEFRAHEAFSGDVMTVWGL